ncbi:MAG: hypothetical protein DIZ80_13175 [endosymbiont of Galathealinum brachiosum]|uniref:Uncharacterized protein n=1 Tax=endosymbiont of Galathealinum brachiosum TaxID=2200906 RepID=A0A370D809_9GAMM|nr:MAG: hypothetical protein DIZ80_13175 [endosymbiont of Galathealinum brachiosum]
MRMRTKWHDKERTVSVDEKANTMAFISWRIAAALVLNLENENFQTDTHKQRLDVIREALAFLVSVTDRLVAGQMSAEERQEFVAKYAIKLSKTFQENCEDLLGRDVDYKKDFIDTLNKRLNAYAECSWIDDKEMPGFQYKRDFGDFISAEMGARDNKWITDQIIEIEVPEMIENLKKSKYEMVDGRSTAKLG